MSSANETERLIKHLAAGAAQDRPVLSFDRLLLLTSILSLTLAVIGVLVLVGARPDVWAYLQGSQFLFKIASTLVLACGGFVLARQAGRPGEDRLLPLLALIPGLTLFLLYAATDTSGLPVMGRSSLSVAICVSTIVAVALPALALIGGALRTGATTRPTFAGASAGLLAGALAAAAYTLACKNDGGLHVAIWYCVSISIVSGLGAALGRRALAW